MSWVRLHDGAMSHPKICALSDRAFRLWVWGLSYVQTHLTDGHIAREAPIPLTLRRALAELTARQLWDPHPAGGYAVHDYLDWNNSRAYVTAKRRNAQTRMAQSRQLVAESLRAPPVRARTSREQTSDVHERTNSNVPIG